MQSVSTDFARVLIGVLLLAGCGSNGGDTPINDAVVGESRDVDGDGFAVGSEINRDCDDNDAAVNPDAEEVCDEIDNNCDGEIDEGVTNTFYADEDGDSFGDLDNVILSCQAGPPAGFRYESTDCDDSDAEINPDADELCDAVDRNCDGDPTLDAIDLLEFFADLDGDGEGSAANVQFACSMPPNYIENSDDCNDLNADVNTLATEICNEFDDNCDGMIDEDGAVGAPDWYVDFDGDTFGDPATGEPHCELRVPNGFVADDTDCNDQEEAINPNAQEVCDGGVDNDCDLTTDEDIEDGRLWYPDVDTDGYGASDGTPIVACEDATRVNSNTDCDDQDENIRPNAIEICNTLDDNCDGVVDEDTAVDATIWYDDADGDTYGDPATGAVRCDADGGVADDTDCDDLDIAINPIAVEVCDGGVDNDCDPTTDEDASVFASTWYDDLDDDSFGDPATGTMRCDADGGVADATDCDDLDVAINPIAVEVCDGGVDNDCDPTTDEEIVDSSTWYFDGDGDSFGLSSNIQLGCEPLPDYVSVDGDCDDTDDTVIPGVAPDCIQLHCGTIATNETWIAAYDHVITCDVAVEGPATPILMIADGAVVRFQRDTEITVGEGDFGALFVDGVGLGGVVLTSDEATPNNGDWGGVKIGSNDVGSVLTGLTIEYGGGNGRGGLWADGSSPIVEDAELLNNQGAGYYGTDATLNMTGTTVSGNWGTGVDLDPGSAIAVFTGNDLTGNDSLLTTPASGANFLDAATSTFTGNTNNEVVLTGDTLSSGITWRDLGVPYRVTGDVLVSGGPPAVLTVLDGVVATFDPGVHLRVGTAGSAGRLDVQGSSAEGVSFGSSQPVPDHGDWAGITLGADDAGSTLVWLDLGYAGSNSYGNLYANGASPVLNNVTSHHSFTSGMYVSGDAARPLIANSTFSVNYADGVFIADTAGLNEVAPPTFVGNTLSGNTEHSIVLPGRFLNQLDASSSFINNGLPIEVTTDIIDIDVVWPLLDEDYEVTGDLLVSDAVAPTLTVEDGVVASFGLGKTLDVAAPNAGRLDVLGGALGVVFTSNADLPSAGDWQGVLIGSGDGGSSLLNLTVEYAGGNGMGGVYADSSDPYLDGCTLNENLNSGFFGEASFPEIRNTSVTSNTGDGVYLDLDSRLDPGVDNTFQGNVLTGNGGYPLVVSSESLDELSTTSTYAGGNGIERVRLWGGTLASDGTLRNLGADYEVFNDDLIVRGVGEPVLTVDDGVTIHFDSALDLIIADIGPGALMVEGTVMGVRFTSAQVPPAPGDWGGVEIGGNDLGSVLTGLTIEYGGGNGKGGLWANGSSPTLVGGALLNNQGAGYYGTGATLNMSGTTVSGNTGTGVDLDPGSAIAVFTGNDLTGNDNPLTVSASGADFLDAATSTFTGNINNEVVLTGSTLFSGITWRDLGVPYRVTGDVLVSGGPPAVLTVLDGVVATFDPGVHLRVGTAGSAGRLDVQGSLAEGVSFGSSQPVPDHGDWAGITLGADDAGSTLVGLDLGYAGSNNYGNLYANGASPVLNNVTSHHSSTSGMYVSGDAARPLIANSTFSVNYADGVFIADTAGLNEVAPPTFVGNTLSGNTGSGIALPANSVRQLAATSFYSGNGERIEVSGGVVSTSGTWLLLDEDYWITAGVYVEGVQDPILTLADGVTLFLAEATELGVGVLDDGGLVVDGVTAGVQMTSANVSPNVGDWRGVTFGVHQLDSRLSELTIEYGGSNTFGNLYFNGLNIDGTVVEVSGVTSQLSSSAGLYARNSAVWVHDSTLQDNNDYGIELVSGAALDTANAPSFANNLVIGNGGYPVGLPPASVSQLDITSDYLGNGDDRVEVSAGTVVADATWQNLGVPLHVVGDVLVAGSASPHLEIQAGVRLEFDVGMGLEVGTNNPGSMSALGLLSEEVVFTSSDVLPLNGAWSGITLGASCVPGMVSLDFAVVEFGGGNGDGAVLFDECAGFISNSTVQNSSRWGIYQNAVVATISGAMTYSMNSLGDVVFVP